MKVGSQLASPLSATQDCSPREWCCTWLGWVFLLPKAQSRKFFTDRPTGQSLSSSRSAKFFITQGLANSPQFTRNQCQHGSVNPKRFHMKPKPLGVEGLLNLSSAILCLCPLLLSLGGEVLFRSFQSTNAGADRANNKVTRVNEATWGTTCPLSRHRITTENREICFVLLASF